MTIEAGKFYKLRNGLKARIYATDANNTYPIHGAYFADQWLLTQWRGDGRSRYQGGISGEYDIISEWVDKPDKEIFSTLPPWIKWVAKDEDRTWWGYTGEPYIDLDKEEWDNQKNGKHIATIIPPEYAPQWDGDWKDSLIGRDDK